MKRSVVFDSGDPKLPNLPESDEVNWSDYSNYNFSAGEESDSSSFSDEGDDSVDVLSLESLQNRTKKGRSQRSSFNTNNKGSSSSPSINLSAPQTLNKTQSHRSKHKNAKHNKNRKGKTKSKKFVSYFEDSFNDLAALENEFVNENRPQYQGTQSAHTILQPSEAHRKAAGAGQLSSAASTRIPNQVPQPFTGEGTAIHNPLTHATSSASFPRRNTDTVRNRKKKARKYFESKTSSSEARKRADWEPGIDISTTKVALSSPGSAITVTDYSETRYRVEHFEVFSEMAPLLDDFDDISLAGSKDFIGNYIDKVNSSKREFSNALNDLPSWSKVRWINVNGLSWEAITSIADKYQLHRLAIEDMIDVPQRTKVDRYPHHLFAVFPLLKLIKVENDVNETRLSWKDFISSWHSDMESSTDPSDDWVEEETYDSYDGSSHLRKIPTGTSDHIDNSNSIQSTPSNASESLSAKIKSSKKKQSLTSQIANMPMNRLSDFLFTSRMSKSRKLHYIENHRPLNYRGLTVGVEQTSLFITDSNTVISFFEHSAHEVEKSILSRLSTEKTLLRDSCDPSILFQSILDSVVDLVYPIVTAYNRRLSEFEYDILISPTMSHTKELHLMIGELARLKSSILPITSMVNQLKDQAKSHSNGNSSAELSKPRPLPLISEATEIYLSDVYDHTISFSDDIDSMRNNIENLTNLIFNTISVNTNYSMQSLSIITVIFLPLSFWTGYYGMNFTKFGDLHESVSYYWKVAAPFSAGLMMLIMWSSLIATLSKYQKMVKRWVGDFNYKRKLKKDAKKAKNRRTVRNRFVKAFSTVDDNRDSLKNDPYSHNGVNTGSANQLHPSVSSASHNHLQKTLSSASSLHKILSKKSEGNNT